MTRPSIREAMSAADAEEYQSARALAAANQAVAQALEEVPPPQNGILAAPDRARIELEALMDAMNACERQRDRTGRRVFSVLDAKACEDIWRVLKAMPRTESDSDSNQAWRG